MNLNTFESAVQHAVSWESRAGVYLPQEISTICVTCRPIGSLRGLWMSCSREGGGNIKELLFNIPSYNFLWHRSNSKQLLQVFYTSRDALDSVKHSFHWSGLFLLTLCFLHFMEKFSSMSTQSARTRTEHELKMPSLIHPKRSIRPHVKVQASRK